MTENKYPRFIQTKPNGSDKYEGGSQKRLADAIAKHIINTDANKDKNACLARIIGLEGVWGSGKSNVIKRLEAETELKPNYYFFEYDAWGHQEDLQRRSLLEILTSKLIEDKILVGNTTLKIKGGGSKEVSWPEKLKYLLARKTETITEKYPRISSGMAAAALVAILTPVFVFIAYATKPQQTTWWSSLISIVISMLPILVAIFVWYRESKKDEKYKKLDYLLAIYNDKVENDICYETLSEDEPTVVEFKAWMQDISNFIGENGQNKLVLVFDNMDRLPADKVKQLWSSIHTFFSDGGFENIWVIIPFDEKHLACAFDGDDETKNKKLTKHFISKTFPIVYRVAPPVNTDHSKIFNDLYTEAFGNTQSESQEIINRIYRLVNPDSNIREIISFINQLVALKSIWEDEIDIKWMAIFALKKDAILEQPTTKILSGDYLGDISKVFSNNDTVQNNIAALVYGIDIEHAKQIPLTKYLEGCLNLEDGFDINMHSEHKQFFIILDQVVRRIDKANADKMIACLSKLDTDNENNKLVKIWSYLAEINKNKLLEKQELTESYKILIQNISKTEKEAVVNEVCSKLIRFKEFSGSSYYSSLKNLEDFLTKHELGNITIPVSDKQVSAEIFVDYVSEAKVDYGRFKLKTNSDKLDSYFTDLLPEKLSNIDVIQTLQEDTEYSFSKLLKGIESVIGNKEVTETNLESILAVYKILSPTRKLAKQIDISQATVLFSNFSTKSSQKEPPACYYDLIAMMIAVGTNVNIPINDKVISEVAGCIECYSSYGDLLTTCISVNIPLLNSVLKYMTQKQIGTSLSIEKILPEFNNIITRIGVSNAELLTNLSIWHTDAPESIHKDNIQTIIPSPTFFEHSVATKTKLTDYLNKTIVEALAEVDTNTLYKARTSFDSDYWYIVMSFLISTEFMKPLSNNINELGKLILKDVASGTQALPIDEPLKSVVEKLKPGTTKATIKDIKNGFCNNTIQITAEKFCFFHEWFEQEGDFKTELSGSIARTILKPLISNETCLKIILNKSNFYSEVINNAGDEASDLKAVIEKMLKEDTDTQLIAFAEKIGIKQEKPSDNEKE